MFNFDTDIVINNLAATDVDSTTDENLLVIKRIGNYKKGTIKNVVLTPYAPCSNGSINLSGCIGADKDIVRVSFKIACSGKYGEFAMANWHAFEKAVMVEFLSDGTAAPLVAALKSAIDADVAIVGDGVIKDAEGTVIPAGKVILTEPIFSIVKDSVKAVKVTENCSACGDYAVEVETDLGVTPAIVAPVEGTGNYYQLIQNLRYPSRENLRFASPNEEEMPLKKGKYDQLSFDIVVERENPAGGLSAAGQVITSKVHQVLFVEQDCEKDAAALKTLFEALA